MSGNHKRDLGQYFTRDDVWLRPHLLEHLNQLRERYTTCVDPFAGDGHLLRRAEALGFEVHGYDTDETICRTNGWGRPNDSIRNVPLHTDAFVLTNPPYLAKNSAKRMGSPSVAYFSTETAQTMNHSHANILDDVFKLAIEQTLPHYEESMWIVPESVVQDLEHLPHWRTRLHSLTVLEDNPFTDTEHPVCVLVFSVSEPRGEVWKNDTRLGHFDDLWQRHHGARSAPSGATPMTFNSKSGRLGYRAVDGTKEDGSMRICFCLGDDLGYERDRIKVSSRHMTYIDVVLEGEALRRTIAEANRRIEAYRRTTHDVFLTAFMGNTKNGVRRRRMDYFLARRIFNAAFLQVRDASNSAP